MKKYESYARVLPWFMALVLSVLLAACGGGRDPILGAGGIGALVAPTVTAPTVTAVTPQPNVTGVPANTRVITAAFTKAMDPATLTADSFKLVCPAGSLIGGTTVTYLAAGNVARLALPANLPISAVCTATVTTAAKDTTGVALANDFAWNFTTAATADTSRPQVRQTAPLTTTPGPTIDQPINTAITAEFTENMDPATITATSFAVTCSAPCVSPAGNVSYVVGSKTAIFKPTAVLAADTVYTATIAAAATDLAGNQLAGNPALLPAASNYVWTFKTGAISETVAPLVTSTNPNDVAGNVCVNKTVNATFSEAMDAQTIGTGTFMLATTSAGTSVNGVVAYDAQTNIATFNPVADLTGTTSYTATIKGGINGVKDLAGNALVADKIWTFTTGTNACQTPVPLGSSSNFAILASAEITNIPTSAITGDVGLTPDTGSNISGFSAPLTCPEVTGTIYAVDAAGPACAQIDPVRLQAAKDDALVAFTNARAAVRGTPTAISGDLNGLTLYPGLYESGTSLEISPAGVLYLNAQGDVNAVFIIRSETSITTEATSQVVLTGGAKATNVFWTAGSAVTLGTNSVMKGTLIAGTAVSLKTGANLEGRALNQGAAAAAITLDSSTITVPLP